MNDLFAALRLPERYFDAVWEAAERAAATTSTRSAPLQIAGAPFRLHSVGHATAALILPALAHLCVESDTDDDPFTIYVWDSAESGVPLPRIPWNYAPDRCTRDYGTQGEIRGYNDARFGVLHHQWFGQLTLIDRARRRGIVWFADAAAQPYWERAFPLRPLLHLWSRDTDLQLLHAAAVGTPRAGVLLIGVSGAGKSSTALACVPDGESDDSRLRIAGDDYAAVQIDSVAPMVYSLYNMAKLTPDSVARFPHFRAWIDNPERLDREKAMIPLHQHAPAALIPAFPLRAILLPRIAQADRTTITPARRFAALYAAAPTTIFQLIAAKAHTLHKLRALVECAPVYEVALGTDRREIRAALTDFCEGL
jgi:hypothetical protein